MWHAAEDGTIEDLGGSYDDETGLFSFGAEHLSRFLLVRTAATTTTTTATGSLLPAMGDATLPPAALAAICGLGATLVAISIFVRRPSR